MSRFNVNTSVTEVAPLSTEVAVVDLVILTLPSINCVALITGGTPPLNASV